MTEQHNQRSERTEVVLRMGSGLPVSGDQPEPTRRRPYTPPLVQSGAAFERVQLQSGCVFFDPLDCDPPCG